MKIIQIFVLIGFLFISAIAVKWVWNILIPENYEKLQTSMLRSSVGNEINLVALVQLPKSKAPSFRKRLHPSGQLFQDLGFQQDFAEQNFTVHDQVLDIQWPFSGITISGKLIYQEDHDLMKYYFEGVAKMETVTGKYLNSGILNAEVSASIMEKSEYTGLVLNGVIYSDHFEKISPSSRYLIKSQLDNVLVAFVNKYFNY